MADQPPPAPPVISLWHESVALRDQTLLLYQERRRRAFRVLAVIMALVGLLLVVLFWLSPIPHPYFAPIWITDYQSRQLALPLGPPLDRDAFRTGGYFGRRSPRAFEGPDRAGLLQELTDLNQRSSAETVVVYLSALSRTGPNGEAYVLPADADPTAPETWLPLTEVLQRLQTCRAHAKLVILDIMAPQAGPTSGVLLDDVAAAVQAETLAVPDSRRFVLCACSPGQVALGSPEMGRTVFSYYLEEGLRGWADGYGGRAKPDRRVSLRELVEFVRARVDRWAWRNRMARQTPMLLPAGPSSDVDLLPVKQGVAKAHLGTAEETPYPAWLAEGWKMRQAWQAEEAYRTTPHLFRELEVVLLEAEKEWLHRVDPARARDNRSLQIQGLAARKQLFRFPPAPEAYSLALAEAQGRRSDPEILPLVRTAVSKTGSPAAPPPAKPAAPEKSAADKGEKAEKPELPPSTPAEASEKLRTKPHADVAWGAFELLANDPDPRPEKVRQLHALLQQQEPRPRYVETLFIERLAELAAVTGEAGWPRDTVRRAIDVVRRGERAASLDGVFDWVRGPLTEASQKRHQGETLLFAPGYAPIDEADALLRRAAAEYEVCLNLADVIGRARQTLDEAMAFLPAAMPYVERDPRAERDWLGAVRLVDELYRALQLPADPHGKPLPTEEVLARAEGVRNRTDELQQRLSELRRPFVPTAWASLKEVMNRPDTGPYHLLEIEALLATPFLSPDDRAALWKAHRGLARRLHEQTRELDLAEDSRTQSITPSRFGPEGDIRRAMQETAARRARLSIALLRLGGIDADAVANLENGIEPAGWFALDASFRWLLDAAGIPSESLRKLEDDLRAASGKSEEQLRQAKWFDLGQALHYWWTQRVPELLERQEGSRTLDRLSRVFSAVEVGLVPADPPMTPQIQLRQERARALWSWLADWDRYLARDALNQNLPDGSAAALYTAASDTYAHAARTPVPERYVQMTGAAGPFVPGGSPYPLRVRLVASQPDEKATLRLFTRDDAWLLATPQASVKEGDPGSPELPVELTPQTSIPVPLQIALKSGARPMPPPRGLLVRVMSNERAYHHFVPVTLQGITDRLEILLSTDGQQPTSPVGELRLRPMPRRQEFHLYVRNPSAKPRNVIVQLRVNNQPLPGAEAKVMLPPERTSRIAFPPPPAPPPPPAGTPATAAPAGPVELPELTGPLQVRLLDGDNRDLVLEEKWYPVGVASPREYVQVTNIQFVPAGFPDKSPTKNRLTVAIQLAREPGCTAELVLPRERVPGLREVKAGHRSGAIQAAGGNLTLYAEDLILDDGADEDGHAYLNIDQCARAFIFRTTFARRGEPTTPREETLPAVRLRAPAFVRTGDRLPVTVEVDNAPAGATLELAIGRLQAGVFAPESTRNLPTARHTRIGFAPSSSSGAMLFDAMIRDWSIELDTLRIKGERALLARLRDSTGQVLRTDTLRVVIDDQPAEKVKFINVPPRHRKDVPLVVEAIGQPPVSGLKEVNFFFGKPMDNKVPANTPTLPGTPLDKDSLRWGVKFPLAGERRGPTDISVEFKSNVGLSSFATATVDLLDSDMPEPGKVEGRVLEGPRPQAGLEVVLVNEKNEEKGRATTGEDGTFKLENVPPGKYRVRTAKPATKRKGEVPVQVESGKTAKVEIALSL